MNELINIDELLELEKRLYNKGLGRIWDEKNREYDSLSERLWLEEHIEMYNNMTEVDTQYYQCNNLTKEEAFLLIFFTARGSKSINHALSQKHSNLDVFQSKIVSHFDNLLLKIRKQDGKIVYRMDNYSNEIKSNANKWFFNNLDKIIKIPWFLSTTTEDWDFDVVWEITLLQNSLTKAHNIYNIINHGNETEVRFERNSKFLVAGVQEKDSRLWVFLTEVDSHLIEHQTLFDSEYSDRY